VRLPAAARRVVSLVPSATETITALGAASRLVGRTRYDTAAAVRHAPSVGGGLDPSVEGVLALRPDLVVTWASRDDRGFAARLRAAGVATYGVEMRDTAAVFRASDHLGRLLGHDAAARALNARLRGELAAVAAEAGSMAPRPTVLFVVWPDPPTTAGPATFISQVVSVAGGRPAFPDVTQDWPRVSMEEVVRRQPDVVLLPVGESGTSAAERLAASPGWQGLRAVREGRIARVEADLANRPGPNIARAALAIRDSLRAVLARHPL
jgi:iron complex transport system substrate-binding protein